MYSITELAKKLDCTRQSIYNWLKKDTEFRACATKPFNKYIFNEVMIKEWYEKKTKRDI